MPDSESHLVQLLLPTRDNDGRRFPEHIWENLKHQLAQGFGGLTAFTRAPAEGVWAPTANRQAMEDVFVVDVMVSNLDKEWWARLRAQIEKELDQEHVVIRALPYVEL